jgi:hypothetical protein
LGPGKSPSIPRGLQCDVTLEIEMEAGHYKSITCPNVKAFVGMVEIYEARS